MRLVLSVAVPLLCLLSGFSVEAFSTSNVASSLSRVPSKICSSPLVGEHDVSSSNPIPWNEIDESDPNDQRYSADAWLHNIRSLPNSSILRKIRQPVFTITVWSTVVSVIYRLLHILGKSQMAERLCISSKPHSFLVSALGLLLVFRTNSAYQRFAEGRRIWENILSVTRNTSRLASLYEVELGEARKLRVFRLLAAFPYLLRHHIQPNYLRQTSPVLETPYALQLVEPLERRRLQNNDRLLFKQYKPAQTPEETPTFHSFVDKRELPWSLFPDVPLRKCAASLNRPLWVCDRLSRELTDVPYTPNFTSRERLTFLSNIGKLSTAIGECERIHQTAVPLNYARHSLRSLTIWLLSLPFALISELGLLTGPVMAVTSWLMFGVYQIGYTIEDPFQGSLRLKSLCDAVFRDVMYDSSIGSRRESAFHMEDERNQWDPAYKDSLPPPPPPDIDPSTNRTTLSSLPRP